MCSFQAFPHQLEWPYTLLSPREYVSKSKGDSWTFARTQAGPWRSQAPCDERGSNIGWLSQWSACSMPRAAVEPAGNMMEQTNECPQDKIVETLWAETHVWCPVVPVLLCVGNLDVYSSGASHCDGHLKKKIEDQLQAWRDGSAFRSEYCSSREPTSTCNSSFRVHNTLVCLVRTPALTRTNPRANIYTYTYLKIKKQILKKKKSAANCF